MTISGSSGCCSTARSVPTAATLCPTWGPARRSWLGFAGRGRGGAPPPRLSFASVPPPRSTPPSRSAGVPMTQTVVITGASAGIARATARLYGERGDRVGLIARGQAGAGRRGRRCPARWRHPVPRGGRHVGLRPGRQGCQPDRGGPRADRRVDQRSVHLGVRARPPTSSWMSSAGSRRSATSVTCTARWPRCSGCERATAARSCRWDPR